MGRRHPNPADRMLAAAWSHLLAAALLCSGPAALAQDPQPWWAPLARDVGSVGWTVVDATGFGPEADLVRLELTRQATPGARGYWIAHLRARYAAPKDLPGVDGEDVRTREVYLTLLLDCERDTWLAAGAYGAVAAGAETLLAPLAHAGLEATDVALARVARLGCRQRPTAQARTAPEGAVLVDLKGAQATTP